MEVWAPRGAATSGGGMSLGSPNGPRGIHAALVDASAMGTRARIANRARGSARGATPFFARNPGAGATLADEEIWRGRGSSGARTYVDALGHPETNLRLAHRVLFVLVLSDPPEPPSPCPPPIARSTDTRPRNS